MLRDHDRGVVELVSWSANGTNIELLDSLQPHNHYQVPSRGNHGTVRRDKSGSTYCTSCQGRLHCIHDSRACQPGLERFVGQTNDTTGTHTGSAAALNPQVRHDNIYWVLLLQTLQMSKCVLEIPSHSGN